MRTFSLTRDLLLPLEIETVFGFFSDAANLELLTPPWLRFEVLTSLPIEMHQGARIDYRLRLRGIPVRWQSEITVWKPFSRFVDRQQKGPYRLWVHDHRFESTSEGTRVIDEVTYAVRGAGLTNRLLVRPDLNRIFDYRAQKLADWARSKLANGNHVLITGRETPSVE